jgi:hypothetical protein
MALFLSRHLMTTPADRDSGRLNQALWLVLRRYGRQISRRAMIALPALVMPGIGDVLVFYLARIRRSRASCWRVIRP